MILTGGLEHTEMELILLALVLAIFLSVSPVRTKTSSVTGRPAAIWRHVDLDEIRHSRPFTSIDPNALQKLTVDEAERAHIPRSIPTIEQDNVETVTYKNVKMTAIARGELLLLRIDEQ
jgi:hypothetical protein